jgi:hypothetical protein
MSDKNAYESELWRTLEKEGLADISQFHKPGFFDEAPLYSRTSDVPFLSELAKADSDPILLSFALKFLRSVISYEAHSTPYFAAITVWNFSDHDPIVPSIFVRSDSLEQLYRDLTLRKVESRFGRDIRRRVSRLHLADPVEVVEDSSTANDMSRVFIAPAVPPYPAFVPVYMFLSEAKLAR